MKIKNLEIDKKLKEVKISREKIALKDIDYIILNYSSR